jgi:hypothetical protein
MQAQWIFSSTFLPYTGEPIEFMLEDREQPIHGIFANGLFRSRWADYDSDRVQSWRGSDGDPSAAPIAIPEATTTAAFITTMRRLCRILSGGGKSASVVPPRSHARAALVPAIATRAPSAAMRHFNGNQVPS